MFIRAVSGPFLLGLKICPGLKLRASRLAVRPHMAKEIVRCAEVVGREQNLPAEKLFQQ